MDGHCQESANSDDSNINGSICAKNAAAGLPSVFSRSKCDAVKPASWKSTFDINAQGRPSAVLGVLEWLGSASAFEPAPVPAVANSG